ncbi:MAG TPA: N-acetylmuramoyl-L-alanine amidase [Verrucomicrobiae bacterium]|nr:N-acetylmuramoyl-L-alanine amidase [Verrucomicrobiae bacterium]
MFKNVGIIFVAALFLAGCASAPNVPNEVVEPMHAANGVSSLNWSSGKAPVFEANQPSELSPQNPSPVVPVKPANPPVTTWTSLASWAAEHKVGKPHWISNSPIVTYAVGSANGVMILGIGSRDATWNGVGISLGFAPQIIDGEIYLHGLDLQKNLEPLLCAPPLTFNTNRIIVIDPGHGGSNIGTHSVLDGRFEKEFTFDWAKRLKPLLETNGWKVFLTRDSDMYVTNASRVTFTTAHHADLFISLHFNSAAPDTKQAGLETYWFTPTGMPSTLTRGYSDPWAERLSSDDFDGQNLQLAMKMQTALLHAVGMEDRGVRHVRYIEVLRNQKCPAILIEGGYLSNPHEAKLIESADYRQKLAEAVANALR